MLAAASGRRPPLPKLNASAEQAEQRSTRRGRQGRVPAEQHPARSQFRCVALSTSPEPEPCSRGATAAALSCLITRARRLGGCTPPGDARPSTTMSSGSRSRAQRLAGPPSASSRRTACSTRRREPQIHLAYSPVGLNLGPERSMPGTGVRRAHQRMERPSPWWPTFPAPRT